MNQLNVAEDLQGSLSAKENLPDFVMPEFCRVSWVGSTAQAIWEPRLKSISLAITELELQSVKEKMRKCSLATVAPQDLIEFSSHWIQHGLASVPFQMCASSPHGYSTATRDIEIGKPVIYRVAVGNTSDVAQLVEALHFGDNNAIGNLLGYPDCCRSFFTETWEEKRQIDTTWDMFQNFPHKTKPNKLEYPRSSWLSMFWRWLGVRSVWHLPCNPECSASLAMAASIINLGEHKGYKQEMAWLKQVLSWPVEWSASSGIAEIKTPILKLITNTDTRYEKRVIHYLGREYPGEGASGLGFPYRPSTRKPVEKTTAFLRGINNQTRKVSDKESTSSASDNGFDSLATMHQKHREIRKAALAVLAENDTSILDLGCGNGALLKSIQRESSIKNLNLFGIDLMKGPIRRAINEESVSGSKFIVGNLFSADQLLKGSQVFDLALLMPGRLLEANPEEAEKLLDFLARRCKKILAYAYTDWLERFNGLSGLIDQLPALIEVEKITEVTSIISVSKPQSTTQ